MIDLTQKDLLQLLHSTPALNEKSEIAGWVEKREIQLSRQLKARKILSIALIIISFAVSFIALLRSDEQFLSAFHLFLSTSLMSGVWIYIRQVRLMAEKDLAILNLLKNCEPIELTQSRQ